MLSSQRVNVTTDESSVHGAGHGNARRLAPAKVSAPVETNERL